jgi:ESAT-6 family protein
VTSGVAQTRAESPQMTAVAAKFDVGNQTLQTMLSQLMSQLSELSGTWKGLGAAAFEQVKVQYEADLKSMNQALSETAASIRDSATSYDSTDTDAASQISNTGGHFQLPL